jgi:four helix bundle protein
LKIEIEQLTRTFPGFEKYRLTDQLIRSSRGINGAIAEGHGRYSFKEKIHYCFVARGSLNETLNHLIDAHDSKYIVTEKLIYFKEKIDEVEKLLNGYITFLRKQAFHYQESNRR